MRMKSYASSCAREDAERRERTLELDKRRLQKENARLQESRLEAARKILELLDAPSVAEILGIDLEIVTGLKE